MTRLCDTLKRPNRSIDRIIPNSKTKSLKVISIFHQYIDSLLVIFPISFSPTWMVQPFINLFISIPAIHAIAYHPFLSALHPSFTISFLLSFNMKGVNVISLKLVDRLSYHHLFLLFIKSTIHRYAISYEPLRSTIFANYTFVGSAVMMI